ncbi:hypothetical protein [Variovorax fucosicus]|uniref:hypothetical protein n=1 Tax=Variovorax fucosicus TaxID=3053517 RepID=UPI0025775304|nr:hypothetical protein [Variovorax sp. J22G47]MDM0056833.1 hypothetical protein [Variovorax sp. J22G47]
MKRISMPSFVSMLALATGLFSSPSFAQQSPLTRHHVTDSVDIDLSDDWRVATRTQVVEFEEARKEMLDQAGVRPKVKPHEAVTFQAVRSMGSASITLGVTVMPGEASQSEVVGLSGQRIQQLVGVFEQQFRTVLASAGGSDVVFSRPALAPIGGKTAIAYSVAFRTPDGVVRSGVKYHVYMRNATVVMSTTAADTVPKSLRDAATAALRTVQLAER